MKNKKMTYFLGLLVIGVWGMIIYRIFKVVGGEDDTANPVQAITSKETFNDYSQPKDTTRLLLNYRDPFTEASQKDTTEIPVSKLIRHANITPIVFKPATNWSFIRYAGFIHNPGSKKIIAMVSINGKEQMLAEGETADQVKLIKNLRDSIQVSYQGKIKYITMNTTGQ